jgi:hypothetical protein
VALIFTQIVVGTLVSSWSGRGVAEEEVSAEGDPAEAEPA